MRNQKLITGTIWITGLSASGKSSLGRKLFNDLKAIGVNNIKLLDGEAIRRELGNTYRYMTDERNSILEKTIQRWLVSIKKMWNMAFDEVLKVKYYAYLLLGRVVHSFAKGREAMSKNVSFILIV